MAETSSTPPAPVLAPTATPASVIADAVSGLDGWASLQRAVNVTLPRYLDQAEALIQDVVRGV